MTEANRSSTPRRVGNYLDDPRTISLNGNSYLFFEDDGSIAFREHGTGNLDHYLVEGTAEFAIATALRSFARSENADDLADRCESEATFLDNSYGPPPVTEATALLREAAKALRSARSENTPIIGECEECGQSVVTPLKRPGPVRYERRPELDKRIKSGDDFAGDAWVRYTVPGYKPEDAA